MAKGNFETVFTIAPRLGKGNLRGTPSKHPLDIGETVKAPIKRKNPIDSRPFHHSYVESIPRGYFPTQLNQNFGRPDIGNIKGQNLVRLRILGWPTLGRRNLIGR